MKTQLTIAAILIVVLGGAGGLFYYSGWPAPATSVDDPSRDERASDAPKEKTVGGVEVAKKTYGYIESQKRPDGLYNYATGCDDSVCKFDFRNPHDISNAWTAYAAAGLYEATGEQKYLEAAKADGEKVLQFCGSGREECVSIVYQIVSLYKVTGDARYLDLAEKEADVLMSEDRKLYDSGFAMLIGGDAKGLADLAAASGDKKYSEDAAKILDGEVSALERELPVYVIGEGAGTRVYRSFACWPQLARVSLYRATGEESYLKEATAYADELMLSDHASNMLSATDIQPCIELYQELAVLKGDGKYKSDADRMVQYMISNQMDPESGSIRFSVDKEFSTLTDSSYMTRLLSRGGEFEVA